MCLGLIRNPLHSLRFKVVFYFLSTFTVALTILLFFFYFIIRTELRSAIDSQISFELDELTNIFVHHGLKAAISQIDEEAEEYGNTKIFFRILNKNLALIATSDTSSWGKIPINWNLLQNIKHNQYLGETVLLPKTNRFVRIISTKVPESDYITQSGIYVSSEPEQMNYYKRLLPLLGIFIVILAGIIGAIFVHKLFNRIEFITKLARTISSSNLQERLPLQKGEDEINDLSSEINKMLDRIEHLIADIQQINDGLAHDLRSPITRIRASSELILRSDDTSPQSQELTANTIEECDRLLSIVNLSLNLSQLDAGMINIELSPINFTEVINEAIELFMPLANDKGLNLAFNEKKEIYVLANLNMLQRIVANLIDNAIKFSDSGCIRLTLKEDNDNVIFTCQDQGVGIPQAQQSQVFNRFYRTNITSHGNGLGLTTCKSFINALGGKITLASQEGQGTSISVTLKGEDK